MRLDLATVLDPQLDPFSSQGAYRLKIISYPGIRLHCHCVGSSYTKEYINNRGSAVQRHAARYVTNSYSSYASVSEMLTHLQWTSL